MEYRSPSIHELRNRTAEFDDALRRQQSSESDSFETLFEQYEANQNFMVGEIVCGKVLSITKDYVVVDIGYKSEG
jgi:small subunit ribosomal protein S1